jgi:hypothetical protein
MQLLQLFSFPAPRLRPLLFAATALAMIAPGLEAQGPCTGPARTFDFWIGEWDVLNRNRPEGDPRWYDTGTATDRVYPVAAGCGIVEHWRGHAYGEFLLGFSLRAFDPGTGQWTLALLWPTGGEPRWGELRGGFRHNRGEFFSHTLNAEGDTVVNRFTFSDITSNSLRWQEATSTDNGRSWSSNWIMEFSRRELLYQGPVLNGPTATALRCPGEEHRALDFLLGEWRGVSPESATPEDGEEVRARAYRILEGCAVMERVQAMGRESAWEVFRARAYEPARDKWVEYRVDTRRPRLQRLEADVPGQGEPWVFQTPLEAGESPEDGDLRVTLTRTGEGGLSWAEERYDGEASQWRLQPGVRYLEHLGAPAPGPVGR